MPAETGKQTGLSKNKKIYVLIFTTVISAAIVIVILGLTTGGVISLIGIASLLISIIASFFVRYEKVDRRRVVAETASISKSTFLANVSHEIRTPTNSIMGLSELAIDDNISPKTKDYLVRIRQNCDWLLQIINDMLDISKIESGKMELEEISFDLHDLFVNCRTLIAPKASEKGIMLYFYAEPGLDKRLLGDSARLHQVFVNLLSNAIKFTNTGMIKLISDVIDVSGKTITIHFEVKDSGIGMTAEQIDKIFEPFAQTEPGITRRHGGTGLGLAITKNLVEMMGGKLSVESAPGLGSKFYFDLTFETLYASAADTHSDKAELNELKKPLFISEIIVFEDNVMNQKVICEQLKRVGIKSVVAENGKIGLDIIAKRMKEGKKQFDLIFMDMQMPLMDGFETSAEIIKMNINVPIVAMTANVMSSDVEIYKKNGINDCVFKPFTSRELWRCLLNYLVPVSIEKNEFTSIADEGRESDAQFQRSLEILFAKGSRKKYSEIAGAIEAGDIKLAYRLAHTLKSNAAQLGKMLLHKAAADIELNLKDGINKVSIDQLKILESELSAVLKEYAPLLEESSQQQRYNSDAPPLDQKKTLELFEKLEPLLKSGNPECKKYAGEIGSINGGSELIQQIEDFEFDDALSTIEKLKERMEKPNE